LPKTMREGTVGSNSPCSKFRWVMFFSPVPIDLSW
jgi:hypothetical protein